MVMNSGGLKEKHSTTTEIITMQMLPIRVCRRSSMGWIRAMISLESAAAAARSSPAAVDIIAE